MENNKTFEEEIDLVWLGRALLKRIWLIIAAAVLTACLTAAYTYLRVEPTYSSTISMLVLTKETTLTSLTDLQIGSQLTKDYSILITSRPVLDQVIENLEMDMGYAELKQRISIENPEDTRLLFVTVTLNNAKQAKTVVDELAVVSAEFIADKMEVTPPKIIENGEIGVQSGISEIKNAMIGFMVGAFLMCAVLVALELLNDTIQREEDITKYLDIPTLAVIPHKHNEQSKNKRYEGRTTVLKGKAK